MQPRIPPKAFRESPSAIRHKYRGARATSRARRATKHPTLGDRVRRGARRTPPRRRTLRDEPEGESPGGMEHVDHPRRHTSCRVFGVLGDSLHPEHPLVPSGASLRVSHG